MSTGKDLTRWNRAGLRRFTYVDGNAPLYLERLREEFAEHFSQRWSSLPSAGDEQGLLPERVQFERNRKLVERYQGERRDMGWELARVFARVCHVLTAHVDAHAKEGFLRTATQWEHVRRLVATIDYHPAPATSATTTLVLQAKPDQRGVLPKGFQIKHTPPDGGPQVIFETFADLEVDDALNELRPSGRDLSADELAPNAGPSPAPGPQYSKIANESVEHLQGVEAGSEQDLAKLAGKDRFRIKDVVTLVPGDLGLSPADKARLDKQLTELRPKAEPIIEFELEPGWSDIAEWRLPRIAEGQAAYLSELTGKTLAEVEELKSRIDRIRGLLDKKSSGRVRLKDLLAPAAVAGAEVVETTWKAPRKPQVQAGQVAIVFHTGEQKGQAVTIADITPSEQSND